MAVPSPEQQIEFLTHCQRLLSEGSFVATYKYAFLMALADISVERGTDDDSPLEVPTRLIGEKYTRYYWRQAVPFNSTTGILKQNIGATAGVLTILSEFRSQFDGTVVDAQKDELKWRYIISRIAEYARGNPLERLQNVGRKPLNFLYDVPSRRTYITLKRGVAFCFRKHYSLITDLVKGAWARYVRRYNAKVLGTTSDFHEFLFGSERASLSAVKPILYDFQQGNCFYCHRPLRVEAAHVDHFIPWSRYPVDLGHNFVLAHAACNSDKSDRLAHVDHLAAWVEQRATLAPDMAREFDQGGIVHDFPTSVRIVNWAYQQTAQCGGLAWIQSDELQALPADWNRSLQRLLN